MSLGRPDSLRPPWTQPAGLRWSMGLSKQEHWRGLPFPLQGLRTARLLHCRQIHCQWATREAPVPSDPRGNPSTPGSPQSRPPPPGRSRTDWSSVAKATSDPSRGGLAPQPQSRDSALPWGRPAPHPGDAFLAAQGPQHLGHVAHHARVLHTYHAPLAPQLHWDGGARPSVSRRRRRHPCQSSQAHRGAGGWRGNVPSSRSWKPRLNGSGKESFRGPLPARL